ncbi:unnamed protein product [Mytilus coruscus]|uniref:AIG1-type G domain-containing protein n=1 Tax=Mytilus coruscus TaxID=42192 RepID=A0A6J8AYT1_MYTCO|nr:unnamed protein product [Mytilus coruscus]
MRPTQYQLRVVLDEEDMVRALNANTESQILEDALETLDFSIVNIYEGSLCFLLDPVSEKAIEELWKKTKNIPKIKKFLGRILARFRTKQSFRQKRGLKVEISEVDNDFLIHVNDHSELIGVYTTVEMEPSHCSGCFRKTVLGNYQSILDEIETSMIEETLKTDIVPGCIKTACIDERDKRSRLERADIFLQFVLTNEKLLMAFRRIYEKSSEVAPTPMKCGTHSYKSAKDSPKLRDTIELCFEIDYHAEDDIIVIRSTNDEFRRSWPNFDAIDEISTQLCRVEIEKSSISGLTDEEIRIVVAGKSCSIKRKILDAILGKDTLNHLGTYRYRPLLSQIDAVPVITQLQRDRYEDTSFGKAFIVTTTPDTTGLPIKALRDDILKFLTMTSPGPHIIILALDTSFATEIENYDEMLEPFIEVFGKNIVHHVALVLDKKQDVSIPDIFDNSPICGKLVKKDRLIYCEQQKRHQFVIDILQIVRQIRTETMKPYFSNDLYAKTEDILKQKCLEQYDSQLEEVRRQEVEIASLKEKLSLLEKRQNIITDLNTRESAIKHFDISLLKQIFNRETDKETSTCEIL